MALQLFKKLLCFGFRLPEKTEDNNNNKKRADPCQNSEKKPVVCSYMDNLNLGIKVYGGKMCVFIPQYTELPIKEERFFYTSHDFKSPTAIDVYEGESSLTTDNVWLGTIKLDELLPVTTKFKVCFDIDVNGTLKVSAQDTLSSELKEITITSYKRQLNAMYSLEDYMDRVMQTICDARYEGILNAGEKEEITKVVNEAIEWLKDQNQTAKVYEYKNKQKELEVLWNPIITRFCNDAAGESTPLAVSEHGTPEHFTSRE